jgi:hypothetical protein
VLQPDDLVLLGLDRGDDVAHRPGARRVEGGQQLALRGGSLGVEPVVEKCDVAAVLIDARQFRSSSDGIASEMLST